MSSLKEIRSRIDSVRSTLKITSAMHMVASAKLHSAQKSMSGSVPYERALQDFVKSLAASNPEIMDRVANRLSRPRPGAVRTAVVFATSNQALCGSFNENLLKEFDRGAYDPATTDVYAVGKFGLKHLKGRGYNLIDCCHLSGKVDYADAALLCNKLVEGFMNGEYAKMVFVYTHFNNAMSQTFLTECFLPIENPALRNSGARESYIIEPSSDAMLHTLAPKMVRLAFHAMLLDAATAEHAARSLAMQMATDNAKALISELSLTYNKLRQQAITNEILDLAGGRID